MSCFVVFGAQNISIFFLVDNVCPVVECYIGTNTMSQKEEETPRKAKFVKSSVYSTREAFDVFKGGEDQKIKNYVECYNNNDLNVHIDRFNTPLTLVCQKGNSEMVQWLIDQGADVDFVTVYGNSPLHTATGFDNTEAVKTLIENGANVDAYGYMTNTVVMSSIDGNHHECLRLLLDAGADPNLGADGHSFPLFAAAYDRHVECARALLESGAEVNKCTSDVTRDGKSALHMAALMKSIEIVELLVEYGADVNYCDKYGATPLFHAALGCGTDRGLDCVRVLLELGADVDICNNYGDDALSYADRESVEDRDWNVDETRVNNKAECMRLLREKAKRNKTTSRLMTCDKNKGKL